MNWKFHRMAAVLAVAVPLALAGCGGSDSTKDERDQAQMDAVAAEKAQMEAEAEKAQAETAAEAAKKAQMDAEAAQKEAEAEADKLRTQEEQRMAEEQTEMDLEAAATARSLFTGLDVPTPPTLTIDTGGVTSKTLAATFDAAPITFTSSQRSVVDILGEWAGAQYMRESKATSTTDIAIIYTNQAAPKSTTVDFFKKWDGVDALSGKDILDVNGKIVDAELKARPTMVGSDAFATGAGAKPHATNEGGEFRTLGTFDGASGVYRCTPTRDRDCTSTVSGADAKGIGLSGGNWVFIPAEGAMATTEETDSSYASFGWWLRKSATGRFQVATIHGWVGGDGGKISDMSALEGIATYDGKAIGKYALYPGVTQPTGDAGHFTADVMLEAKFGGKNKPSTVSGMIDGFLGADGDSREWSISLPSTVMDKTGAFDNKTTGTTWTIGTAQEDPAGGWKGNFYEEDADSFVPTTAAGQFTAEHGHVGRMAGAFGATRE